MRQIQNRGPHPDLKKDGAHLAPVLAPVRP